MARPAALKGNIRRHAVSLVRKHGGAMASKILAAPAGSELAAHRSDKVVPAEGIEVTSVTLISYAKEAGANIRTERGRRPNNLVTV
jgi:hypothetical protein